LTTRFAWALFGGGGFVNLQLQYFIDSLLRKFAEMLFMGKNWRENLRLYLLSAIIIELIFNCYIVMKWGFYERDWVGEGLGGGVDGGDGDGLGAGTEYKSIVL